MFFSLFRQDIGQFHSPRMKHLSNPLSRFQLGKFFLIKSTFTIKNLTDFRKTVETGVDQRVLPILFPPCWLSKTRPGSQGCRGRVEGPFFENDASVAQCVPTVQSNS